MIYAAPGTTFEASLDSAPTGLTGTLGVRITDTPAGTIVLARTTAGISEAPAGSGLYAVALPAPVSAGVYSVVWDWPAGPGTSWARDGLTVAYSVPAALALTSYTPTLADVGTMMRARTRNDVGVELGTFTTATRPNATEATAIIEQAVSAVSLRVGPNLPELYWPVAEQLVVLRTAMLIELSYYPEQVESGQSPYEQYERLYNEHLRSLLGVLEGEPGSSGMWSVPMRSVMYDPLLLPELDELVP